MSRPALPDGGRGPRARRGFTLVEALAALSLLALMLPVLMGALGVAQRAASLSRRDRMAMQLAENILHLWMAGALQPVEGVVHEEETPWAGYRWSVRGEAWAPQPELTAWTIEVLFDRQRETRLASLTTLGTEDGP